MLDYPAVTLYALATRLAARRTRGNHLAQLADARRNQRHPGDGTNGGGTRRPAHRTRLRGVRVRADLARHGDAQPRRRLRRHPRRRRRRAARADARRRRRIAGTEIRRACGATSQSRWSSLHYLALETTIGETYVLELSPANLAEVLGYLTVAGAHVDPQPCTWSYRPGGVTLSPRPAEPE